jgi:hypothetical protein
MTGDRWRRLEHVFSEGQQQPREARATFVARICVRDAK